MNRIKFYGLLLAVVIVVSLCACAGSNPSMVTAADNPANNASVSASAGKDTLVAGVFIDPIDMDPSSHNDQAIHLMKRQMYETLLSMDEDGNLVPELCTEWNWIDSTTLVLKLREGVKFHSGGELRASDVLFSFKCIKESRFADIAATFMDLENSKALDDYTVQLKLTKPYAAQVNYFNWQLTAIRSEEGYNQIGGDYNKMSIGTGPYKLVSYVKDSELVLEAFDEYWESGKPIIPNLVFRIIPDENTRTMELESGGIDVALNLADASVERLKQNPKLTVLTKPSYSFGYMYFNVENQYLSDYNVRKAIYMAVDWASLVPAACGPRGSFPDAFFAPGVEGSLKTDFLPAYDPEGAKQLLRDSGYTDGQIQINMYTSNMEVRVKMCELMQAFLRDAGINMNVVAMETAAWNEAFINKEHDMVNIAFFALTGEAGRVLFSWHSSNIYHKAMNWNSPQYDKLIEEAIATLDKESRVKKFQEVQKMILDNLVAFPFVQYNLLVGTQAYVKGLVLDPTFERHMFKNIYFE